MDTIEISVIFRVAFFLREMLKAEPLHHFIKGNRFKGLYDFQSLSHGELRCLFFQPLKEIALNPAYINLFESIDFIFPLHDKALLTPKSYRRRKS